ncbi:MAG: tetratricopeptide repeat protein, partial [Anaerolineales bacterium]|nr:tetratricopeptide repeat protein [Anaerolineales bacterium]
SWYSADSDAAEEYYKTALPYFSAALLGLVSVAFKHKRWAESVELLRQAQPSDEELSSVNSLLAMALKRSGKTAEAQPIFLQVLAQDPLNLLVLNELASFATKSDNEYKSKLQRLLDDDHQYILDLACFYLDAGLNDNALAILESASEQWNYPPLYYLIAYLLGNSDAASTWRARASHAGLDLVFPSRLWEIIALQDALEINPEDYQAKYFLGNFYYSRQRYEEAIQLWEAALGGLHSFDIIHRNLGLAYWQQQGDLVKATQFFEKALGINPENQDLYLHLDDLYNQQNDHQKRAELLAKMGLLEPIREDLRKRKLAIMIDLNQYEQALKIMTNEEFVPLEMDQTFHNVYVRALLKNAQSHLDSGNVEDAI